VPYFVRVWETSYQNEQRIAEIARQGTIISYVRDSRSGGECDG
jgi:hypothetical protein